MKKILCFSLMCLTCFLLLSGCNSENNTGNNEQSYDKAHVYDETQFFVNGIQTVLRKKSLKLGYKTTLFTL